LLSKQCSNGNACSGQKQCHNVVAREQQPRSSVGLVAAIRRRMDESALAKIVVAFGDIADGIANVVMLEIMRACSWAVVRTVAAVPFAALPIATGLALAIAEIAKPARGRAALETLPGVVVAACGVAFSVAHAVEDHCLSATCAAVAETRRREAVILVEEATLRDKAGSIAIAVTDTFEWARCALGLRAVGEIVIASSLSHTNRITFAVAEPVGRTTERAT